MWPHEYTTPSMSMATLGPYVSSIDGAGRDCIFDNHQTEAVRKCWRQRTLPQANDFEKKIGTYL